MAARVAMLGEMGAMSDEEEGHESSDEPLLDSSSESQTTRSKELWGTGGSGGEARSGW